MLIHLANIIGESVHIDEEHRRDINFAKELGANFIRISHYPQDDALLEMCDRLGLIVWEEIPVIDYVPDNESFSDNCEIMPQDMIRRHCNHPSIAMWGYMNEILLRVPQQGRDEAWVRTLNLANRLEKVLKSEDPDRLSTMAFHGSDMYHEADLSGITDIKGWNLYQASSIYAQSVWDRNHLEKVKAQIERPMYADSYAALLENADSLLSVKPLSVMDKRKSSPSGDQHDYVSLARYFHPDPLKPDGLPYINRDGITNPEIDLYDRNRLGETAGRISTLALAWYFSGKEEYAAKATELIDTYYLEALLRKHDIKSQIAR
ncbi:MAG: alginate lyase family protein [Muribaculaceae bacterium]|nr:alginate lyase family protein [Muribaculaceae bacterium]